MAPYEKAYWRGVLLDRRTIAQLEWAERKSGITISPSQGSFRPATSYSGSTHTGSGAVDIRCVHLSDKQRRRLVKALKDSGMAAWYRPLTASWGPHIHALSIGSRHLASSARWQVAQFLARRSGLVSNGYDRTYRPEPQVKWSWKKGKPVPL